jgi:putative IMPACT (imprinted ancient) family translation regulator
LTIPYKKSLLLMFIQTFRVMVVSMFIESIIKTSALHVTLDNMYSRFPNFSRKRMACASHSFTVGGQWEAEETIKKSRFVARCFPAPTFVEARSFIDRVSDPKARHNCWAWRGLDSHRSDDDGEPAGTAGRPILSSIEGERLSNVVVVVTRYKGYDAPLLGAGGLLRAYASASSLVLRSVSKIEMISTQELLVTVPLTDIGPVQSIISKREGRKPGQGAVRRRNIDYHGTSVDVSVVIEVAHVDEFEEEVRDAARGAAVVTKISPNEVI